MQCIIMEKHSNQITHHDETKKRAHDSSLVPNKDMKCNKVRRNSKEIDSPTVSRVTSTVDR